MSWMNKINFLFVVTEARTRTYKLSHGMIFRRVQQNLSRTHSVRAREPCRSSAGHEKEVSAVVDVDANQRRRRKYEPDSSPTTTTWSKHVTGSNCPPSASSTTAGAARRPASVKAKVGPVERGRLFGGDQRRLCLGSDPPVWVCAVGPASSQRSHICLNRLSLEQNGERRREWPLGKECGVLRGCACGCVTDVICCIQRVSACRQQRIVDLTSEEDLGPFYESVFWFRMLQLPPEERQRAEMFQSDYAVTDDYVRGESRLKRDRLNQGSVEPSLNQGRHRACARLSQR